MVVRDRPREEPDLASGRQGETETEGKEWYSPDELWRWLGLGRTKTYELLQSGEIPSYKIGRDRRIRLRDIEAWLVRSRSFPGDE
jgi:excisionase family DNA binding protein